ncbi:hypothetical protein [Kitasatospora cinereorecta]|uniref:Uncharacterized protein n=1 Tax=Kitasatospora cinereorecta TaxID=285560 RepID=A0ABW0VBD5_9ACTN
METAWVDRSDPDVIDLVLREGGGSLRYAARSSLDAVRAAPLAFVFGALLALPVYIVMLLAGTGWGPVRVAAGIAGALYATVQALLTVSSAFVLNVHRLRFSPAAAPATVAVVRGARTGRPRPLTKVRRIRIDHSTEEPYDGDPRPETVTITLTVLLAHRRIPPATLSPQIDTAALHHELHEFLAPVVPVDLFVRHHRRPEPPPPQDNPHSRIEWGALGHGGSTGGGGS